jgi:hypothetical protein
MNSPYKNSPIFITGTQRSGTTLLCRMLEAHPNIYIRNEIPKITQIFSASNTEANILKQIDEAMIHSFGQNLDDFLISQGKNRWGVKDPDLRFTLEHILSTFPDSRIIFIIRDGRAVANSFIKNKWGLGVNVYYGAITWKKEIQRQLEFQQTHPKSCLTVRYEDLIVDTELELRKICDFIEEPFSNNVLEYYKHKTYITKRSQSKNVCKKPDHTIIEKWKNDLSEYQINVIESVAGKTLTHLGYEIIGKPIHISYISKAYFYFHQKILGEVQIQYQWRIKGYLRKFF